MLNHYYPSTGPTQHAVLGQHWASTLRQHWPNAGQALAQHWPSTGAVPHASIGPIHSRCVAYVLGQCRLYRPASIGPVLAQYCHVSWEITICVRVPVGKLLVVIVDDQIRLILLRSMSEISISIHTVGIGKVSYWWKPYGLVYPIYIASCSANVVAGFTWTRSKISLTGSRSRPGQDFF